MKISHNSPNYIQQTYANQTNAASARDLKSPKNAGENNAVSTSDSINLSGLTKEMPKQLPVNWRIFSYMKSDSSIFFRYFFLLFKTFSSLETQRPLF